jgi:hypothetical protein
MTTFSRIATEPDDDDIDSGEDARRRSRRREPVPVDDVEEGARDPTLSVDDDAKGGGLYEDIPKLPSAREATPASVDPHDPAEHTICFCSWCGHTFEIRRGGKRQRFCGEACRIAFHRGCRVWAMRAVDEGRLTMAEIKKASAATYTFLPEGKRPYGSPSSPNALSPL